MLPILPALLLLLLKAPAHFERLAMEGRLPAVLEASCMMPVEADEHAVLAALLARNNRTQWVRALCAIWHWSDDSRAESPSEPRFADRVIPERPAQRLSETFADCRRSRDGPQVI